MAKLPDWALEAAREINLQLPVEGVLDKGIIETLGVSEAAAMFEQKLAEIVNKYATKDDYRSPAMRALVSLTPGGSEFVNDPERCVAVVRATSESQGRVIVQFKKRMDKAEKERDALLVVCQEALDWSGYDSKENVLHMHGSLEKLESVARYLQAAVDMVTEGKEN